MRIVKLIIVLLLVLLGVSFAILNASTVSINYYFGSLQGSLSLVLVLTFAAGAIIGFITSLSLLWQSRRRNVKLKNKLQAFEKQAGRTSNTSVGAHG